MFPLAHIKDGEKGSKNSPKEENIINNWLCLC